MLACLIGYFGDFDLAEEATAEAFAIAAQRWPGAGMPDNPGAWLITTARHRAIDRLRRDRVLAAKLPLLAQQPDTAEDVVTDPPIPDERLELAFMCCHPALAIEAQVALTLRAVAGLSTEEIARAFLVPVETMKRRLTRAKSKIRGGRHPVRRPGRVASCRSGSPRCSPWSTSSSTRATASRTANQTWPAKRSGSARVLAVLLPAEPEVLGLLALMLLHDARREARFDGQDLVLLPDQDRSRWDWRQIAEARDLLDSRPVLDPALRHEPTARGPYALQAAIASLQAEDPLDWPQIAALYAELADRTGSAVVRLNRAVAIAEADGPAAALAIVDGLDLPGYQYWYSTRAELLRRLGRADEARAAYREALALARTVPERRFLERRIAET